MTAVFVTRSFQDCPVRIADHVLKQFESTGLHHIELRRRDLLCLDFFLVQSFGNFPLGFDEESRYDFIASFLLCVLESDLEHTNTKGMIGNQVVCSVYAVFLMKVTKEFRAFLARGNDFQSSLTGKNRVLRVLLLDRDGQRRK